MAPSDFFATGLDHLLAELEWLDIALKRQVRRLRASTALTPDEFRGLYISDEQVDALLADTPRRAPNDQSSVELTYLLAARRQQMDARIEASRHAGIELPLIRLAELFGLSVFERGVVLIAFAPEFDLRYETLYAYAQNDITKKRPGIDLTLRLLTQSLDERLTQARSFNADAPLLRHALVRLFDDPQDRDPSLPARLIKLEPRISGFLLNDGALEARLLSCTELCTDDKTWQELPLADEPVNLLRRAAASPNTQFYFQGAAGAGKRDAAHALCAQRQLPMLAVHLDRMVLSETAFSLLCALLAREARLRGAGIYLAPYEALFADETRAPQRARELFAALEGLSVPVLFGGEAAWHGFDSVSQSAPQTLEFSLPEFELRHDLWRTALAVEGICTEKGLDLTGVATKFRLTPGQIRAAARHVGDLARWRSADGAALSNRELYAAARGQSAQALQRLAHKVEPVFGWDDIVLPANALQQLREIIAAIKHREVVFAQWGMARVMALGKGLKVLFAGPSGTGKTMAAEILANELQLDLYKIDLSTIVSKYIGETEKNLATIFRAAQASNALLFFDEADALFGKRSEVKDAHDRYANIEVAYLLQKMDEYDGAVILATNLTKNVDDAFVRRMQHTVEFPVPDAPHRERIWRQHLPAQAPLGDDIDFTFLASRFELAGGNIRNIALAAAFSAADDGGIIHMQHLLRATAREHHKLGKRPSRADFGDYFESIREVS